MAEERILKTIYQAVEEINQQLPEEARLKLSPDTVLWSKANGLDSMGLVNLIVMTEENIEEEFGKAINLADEKAMSQENSPFQTIETLANYIGMLVKENSSRSTG